jgi:hypothetical protein
MGKSKMGMDAHFVTLCPVTLFKVIKKANYWATPIYDILPSWCFPERHLRFKAYCVGMAKTGTISIHIMFSELY